MTTATETVTLPDVPIDVVEFAEKQRATRHIRPVLMAAHEAFRGAPLRLYLEADPEIANDYRIIVDVDVTGWSADQMFEAYDTWANTVLQVCPANEIVGVFVLRERTSA